MLLAPELPTLNFQAKSHEASPASPACARVVAGGVTRGDIAPSPGVSEEGKGENTGKNITQGQTEGLGEAPLPQRKRQTEIKPEKQVLLCVVAQ